MTYSEIAKLTADEIASAGTIGFFTTAGWMFYLSKPKAL